MTKPIDQQTIVITGASSGIGRETANLLAHKGAAVVLAARNDTGLIEAGQEIEAKGGRVRVVHTDVASWPEVERLAQEAADWNGTIDTWVNNAAVSEYGLVEEMPVEEIARVIQVTLMGQIHGMKAALPHMKRQNQGTIINVASILAERAVPLQAPYCAAKHGIKGFTDSLRMELQHQGSNVHVTLIMPSSINTPFFDHARSRMGVKPQPLPPFYHPRVVAETIAFAAEHPRRDLIVGGSGKLLQVVQRLSPPLLDWYMVQNGRMFRQQQTDEPETGRDNLFDPLDRSETTVGQFNRNLKTSSIYTQLFERHPMLKRAALGAAALGAIALLGSRNGNGSRSRGALSRTKSLLNW